MTNLLILFIAMNALNVVMQTVKSLCTVNAGKTVAAVVNALAYGFYTVIVVYMSCELPLWEKAVIIGACNLVGVYVVKWIEEKTAKDKLWKVELTVRGNKTDILDRQLEELAIPHNCIQNVGKWTVFNIYCATQKESTFVKELAVKHNAKFFVSESKRL